jgi:hypothetical protein
MDKIQEVLFENKERIPEGIYLKLMNELKIGWSKRNDDDIIQICYTRIRPQFRKTGYNYTINLIENSDLKIILKKGELKSNFCESYNETLMSKLESSPFIPFWFDNSQKTSIFKDGGYTNDHQYIFENIKKNEPDDNEDDEFDYDEDNEEDKRKIKFEIILSYDIKYFITSVEKL